MVWTRTWDEKRVSEARNLAVVEKLTSPQIAARLGISIGSVVGLLRREGIKLAPRTRKPPKPKKPLGVFFGKPRSSIKAQPPKPPLELPNDPTASSCLLIEATGCRFVLGEARFQLVCNQPYFRSGGPYCRDHARICGLIRG